LTDNVALLMLGLEMENIDRFSCVPEVDVANRILMSKQLTVVVEDKVFGRAFGCWKCCASKFLVLY